MYKRKFLNRIIMMLLMIPLSEIQPQLQNLILTDTTITTTVSFTHPISITAGPNFIIANGGNATFITGGQIYLRTGVSVALGGIFNVVLDTALVNVENLGSDVIPNKFYLYQNYPNPFNPNTKFRFEVPNNSQVKLIIYDMLGSVVATIVDEFLSSGVYEVSWNAATLPSGIYFYTMESELFKTTRKLVLLK